MYDPSWKKLLDTEDDPNLTITVDGEQYGCVPVTGYGDVCTLVSGTKRLVICDHGNIGHRYVAVTRSWWHRVLANGKYMSEPI